MPEPTDPRSSDVPLRLGGLRVPMDRRSLRRAAVAGVAVAVVVAVVLVLLRPGGDDAEARQQPEGPPPPRLVAETWASPEGVGDDATVLQSLSGASQVVVADGDDLLALDSATGALLWRQPNGSPCEASVVDDGYVALTVRAGPRASRDRCNLLTVVDLRTGTRSWTRPVPPAVNGGYRQLGLSDRVVTFHDRCEDQFLYRFDRASGRPLRNPVPGSFCEGAGLYGDVLATPVEDRRGDTVAIDLRDADTGRVTARLQGFDGPMGADVDAVVTREPLVLDVVRRDHRFLLQVDERGRTVRVLGYQQDNNPVGGHRLVGVADGVMVVTFDYLGRHTYGIDLDTGEVLWTLDGGDTDQVAGIVGGSVVPWYAVGSEVWVTRTLVSTGEQEVLGRLDGAAQPEPGFGFPNLPADTPVGIAGGRVVVVAGGGVRAYELPAQGDGIARPQLSATTRLDQLEQLAAGDDPVPAPDPDDYVAGDGRGCQDLGPAVFRTLGWGPDADLPRSATCTWTHSNYRPDGNRTWYGRVEVGTYVVGTAPSGITDDTPAGDSAGRAHAQLVEAVGRGADRLPGLGDEAWLVRNRLYGRDTKVWVRDRNLIVSVLVSVSDDAGAPRRATTDRAMLVALRDVLTPYGLTAPTRLPAAGS